MVKRRELTREAAKLKETYERLVSRFPNLRFEYKLVFVHIVWIYSVACIKMVVLGTFMKNVLFHIKGTQREDGTAAKLKAYLQT